MMNRSLWITACIGLAITSQGMGRNPSDSSDQPLVKLAERGQYGVIIRQTDVPEIESVATELSGFFTERGYLVATSKGKEGHTRVTLTTEKHLNEASLPPALSKEIALFFESSRDDAYVLSVNPSEMLLVGKTVSGLRAAVERFRGKVANDGSSLKIKSGLEKNSPFIAGRLINISDAARRQTPYGSPFKDADPNIWPAEKLLAYPELFRQFG